MLASDQAHYSDLRSSRSCVHSAEDINPHPVDFVLLACLFSSLAAASLALLDLSAAGFIYATNGGRPEMQTRHRVVFIVSEHADYAALCCHVCVPHTPCSRNAHQMLPNVRRTVNICGNASKLGPHNREFK